MIGVAAVEEIDAEALERAVSNCCYRNSVVYRSRSDVAPQLTPEELAGPQRGRCYQIGSPQVEVVVMTW